ncbi:hypothetical protein GW17_00039086 [Ensete ventricosum]|uniref:Uncharacterized protein n=1 Tax=Ensete ventricosum TaxID=4639 RepID=A0A444DIY1_ENSVE|nr:hypothetical protein GW17_00039086 [Ensete ventricosum]RZR73680.1 hypothetical protein BHM03_00026943 [Ensete ventricosum]
MRAPSYEANNSHEIWRHSIRQAACNPAIGTRRATRRSRSGASLRRASGNSSGPPSVIIFLETAVSSPTRPHRDSGALEDHRLLCGGETCSLSRPRKGGGSLHYLLLRWIARTGLFICIGAPSSRPFVSLPTGSHDLFIIYLKFHRRHSSIAYDKMM